MRLRLPPARLDTRNVLIFAFVLFLFFIARCLAAESQNPACEVQSVLNGESDQRERRRRTVSGPPAAPGQVGRDAEEE